MTSKHLAAVAALAVLAAPTAATAKKPDHAGTHGKGKGQAKAKNVVVKGDVVSVDAAAGTVVLHVTKSNKWGRVLTGDVTFSVAKVKKLGVADTNGDGVRDLADVVAGAKAQAQAKITKDAPQPLEARKFKVYTPETTETETEVAPEVEGTETD